MTPQRRFTLPWAGAVLAAVLSLAPAPAWCQTAASSRSDPRAVLADEILSTREAYSGKALDPAFRKELIAKLRSQSLEVLQATAHGESQEALKIFTYSDGLVYTPVKPCRILDTRVYPFTPLQTGEFRAFRATANLMPQGGSYDCLPLPAGKALVAVVNLAAVNATSAGYIQTEPWAPTPTEPFLSSVLTYSPGLVLSNLIPIALCNPLFTTCTNDFYLRAEGGSVHVVGDVVGYFSPVDARRYQTQLDSWTSPASFAPVTIGATCTPGLAAFSLLDVTGGKMSVQGSVRLRIDHVQGTADEIHLCASTNGGCTCVGGADVVYKVAGDSPTASGLEVTVPMQGVFSFAESTIVYVYASEPSGAGSPDKIVAGAFTWQFVPN